jgi:hypothetical protein
MQHVFSTNERWAPMTKVLAGITTSVDGYIAGPDDGPGKGLGGGGERLHLGVRQSPYATFIDYRVKRQ